MNNKISSFCREGSRLTQILLLLNISSIIITTNTSWIKCLSTSLCIKMIAPPPLCEQMFVQPLPPCVLKNKVFFWIIATGLSCFYALETKHLRLGVSVFRTRKAVKRSVQRSVLYSRKGCNWMVTILGMVKVLPKHHGWSYICENNQISIPDGRAQFLCGNDFWEPNFRPVMIFESQIPVR